MNQAKKLPQQTKYLKIWPLLAMSAWQSNNGGGYRAWQLAKLADPKGGGRIPPDRLNKFIDGLGITKRTRQRWVSQAIDLGLFKPGHNGDLIMVSLANAAIILNCDTIGNPAEIETRDLISKGWRSVVYAGYLATLNSPMSQKVKEKITGVPVRTQQLYLAQLQFDKETNYCKRDLPADVNHLAGYKDLSGRHLFTNEQGEVLQKLPDKIKVPDSVAMQAPRGRSKKAQQTINAALSNGMQGGSIKRTVRLFHATSKGLAAALRGIDNHKLQLVEGQTDLFLLHGSKARAVFWESELPMV